MSNMLLNKNALKLMESFLGDLNAEIYSRQIAGEKKIVQKTASNILNSLEKKHLLKSRTVGRNKLFSLNFEDVERVKRYLAIFENARTVDFFDAKAKIKEIFAKILPKCKGIVIIFGSYAKGMQKKDSDLDVLIVGNCDRSKVKKAADLFGVEVNIKQLTHTDFRKLLAEKDILINEIINNHLIITDVEEYIQMVMRHYYGG